jgi:hypothetical protein
MPHRGPATRTPRDSGRTRRPIGQGRPVAAKPTGHLTRGGSGRRGPVSSRPASASRRRSIRDPNNSREKR